jgi:chromosome segregation ATPase
MLSLVLVLFIPCILSGGAGPEEIAKARQQQAVYEKSAIEHDLEKERLEAEYNQLQEVCSTKETNCDEQDEKCAKLKEECDKKKAELDRSQKKIEKDIQDMELCRQRQLEVKSAIDKRQIDLFDIEINKDQSDQHLKRASDNLKQVEQRKSDLENERDRLIKDQETLKKEMEVLQKRNQNRTNQIESLKVNIADIERKGEEIRDETLTTIKRTAQLEVGAPAVDAYVAWMNDIEEEAEKQGIRKLLQKMEDNQ